MITVENLGYRYRRSAEAALHGLSFAVQPGEIFGFLGPSGAGKSTTQNILIKLLGSYTGRVEVGGRELSQWGRDFYEHIGVAFELPNHFSRLSALENLRYFAALYRRPTREPRELLELLELSEAADVAVAQFSKGMKMRLNLARALLHSPELLFLDEPTSGLDPRNAQRVKELIRVQQAAGTTIFLTTHNMVLAEEICDRVAFIAGGQLRAIDTPQALKLRYGAPTVRVVYQNGGRPGEGEFPLAGLGTNSAFLELLQRSDLQTIHSQEAGLDAIFVKLTGRVLEGMALRPSPSLLPRRHSPHCVARHTSAPHI
ncbi:ABC transporter ATP-binding protein [Candidatus Gracilibacteria bacterium]|nr:ABC transporter ATP-binding protein [Candidatus Gracilibacteria bacterium]